MKLNEAEMRMAYQVESRDPNAVLNEIYMTWRLSRTRATRDTAESLMAKLLSLPNKECMRLLMTMPMSTLIPGAGECHGRSDREPGGRHIGKGVKFKLAERRFFLADL